MKLRLSNLCFHYGGRPVLTDVNADLESGELLAILGPNGVGKTTLLKCINAIHRPCSGAVMVEDRDVLTMSPNAIARTVGYVAQKSETARITVFDAVLMGRKPHIRWHPADKDLRMVDGVLDRLNLTHLSLRHIDQLSGGELQKVAIARTLVQEPELMLLDEPTSSLDLKSQIDILSLIRDVVDDHRISAVMTMHDLNTALKFADKVLFLKDGYIHSTGPACQVTADMVEDVYGLPVDILSVHGNPMVVPII